MRKKKKIDSNATSDQNDEIYNMSDIFFKYVSIRGCKESNDKQR